MMKRSTNQHVALTRRSQALGISVTSLWRILRNDLGLLPYKIKLMKPLDHQKSHMFLNWAEQQLENDSDFYRKIVYSDEAHIWLNGFVNKPNMRYWSDSNPHVLHESSVHPEKITVWFGLWAGGVIGPYFFRDDHGRHVTVNGNRYRSMITEYVWPQLDDMTCGSNYFLWGYVKSMVYANKPATNSE